MGRIRQLDAQTANMIAAGEVVERPMGVVKELVENSIDAGAQRIFVMIEEGGIRSLTVQDDGIGMDAEDAQMAFHRHATSKIQTSNDLWSIHTLGFRGEALPSIASVSKVTLTTNNGEEGTRIVIEYGRTVSVSSYPSNRGTEITVEGLFYQTPARLKHMRSAAYEASLIQDVISRFALSHPEIAFVLVSDGREAFRTTGQGNLLEVVYLVYGRIAAENAIEVSFSDFDYQVSGYLIKPSVTRASRSMMHIFLNDRMVRTYKLYKAVQDGYEDFIVKGRFPMCILNISMDPHLLDVNVHPSKWEVRLSKEAQLEYLIRDNVRSALQSTVLAPQIRVRSEEPVYYEPMSFESAMKEEKPVYKTEEAPVKKEEKPVKEEVIPQPAIREEIKEDNRILQSIQEAEPQPKTETRQFPDMEVIGQLHEKFILCAVKDGLAVIDQHAAQERVHYEEFCRKLNQAPAMMECLIPLTVHASDDLVRRADEINESIADLHITLEPFGHDMFVIRSLPVWMQEIEEEPFLQDVLDEFRNDRNAKYTRLEKKRIATMACHHSIRFNHALTMDEMKEVVRQLKECENPYHCPHGRPTFVTLSEKELAKEFLR